MKRLLALSILFLLLLALPASAASRYVAATGLWTDTATWSSSSCTGATGAAVPTSSDDVILCPAKTVTVPCNTAAALKSLSDDTGWTTPDTGGLIADGSACTAGQVPTFTFSGTSSTTNAYFDKMGPASTFRLVGRSITTDAPWGEPSDLTDNCGGADKTANGITWESAKNECAKYTWANKPFSAAAPTLTNLTLGNLVWFTSGLWRNNFAVVTASSSTTLTIGYGDPDDAFGASHPGAAVNPSFQAARDTALTAWDTSNPTRIMATVSAGTLQAINGASNGHGQRGGSCLITSTATTPAGSGKFYRIAASYDGGAGTDTIILDPWETVAAADSNASFLAVGTNAWIAPCIKPGDRWYSFEPVVWKPATAGTNYTQVGWFNGACPTLNRVYMPNITPAEQSPNNTEAWNDQTSPAIGFYAQSNCSISGPWAIGPVHEIARNGYAIEISNTSNFAISNASIQGNYWITSPADTVTHGFSFFDSTGLVFDSVNVSFINNEAFYAHQGSEETSQADAPFEGIDVTIRNSTIHDMFHKYGLSDSASGINMDTDAASAGSFTLRAYDNILYNVVRGGFDLKSNTQPFTAYVYGNVIGPLHRQSEVDTNFSFGISCINHTGGISQTIYPANNVLLSSIDYNGTTSSSSYGTHGCNSYYNYIGEWGIGHNRQNAATTASYSYGDLIEAAGGVSGTTVPLTTTTMQYGLSFSRGDTVTGSQIVRDMTVRRFCPILGARGSVIQALGNVTPPGTSLDIHYTRNTFGSFCPEAAAVDPTGNFYGGIFSQNRQAISKLVAGSEIRYNLFITGDATASSTWQPTPIYLYDGMTSTQDGLVGNTSFTVGSNICTQCQQDAFACGTLGAGTECVQQGSNGSGNPYTYEANGLNLQQLSPVRRMEGVGIPSITDNRLVPGSLAYGVASGHIGARYSGIISYSRAMQDVGIPFTWLHQRGDPSDTPDATVLPPALRSLVIPVNTGGWLPRSF